MIAFQEEHPDRESREHQIKVAKEERAMYTYQDIQEFQQKYPEREERERILRTMTEEEVRHLARTCGNATTAACFMQFARRARAKDKG